MWSSKIRSTEVTVLATKLPIRVVWPAFHSLHDTMLSSGRRFRQHGNELKKVSVRVIKEYGRRWHPSKYDRLVCGLSSRMVGSATSLRGHARQSQPLRGGQEIFQLHLKGQMMQHHLSFQEHFVARRSQCLQEKHPKMRHEIA